MGLRLFTLYVFILFTYELVWAQSGQCRFFNLTTNTSLLHYQHNINYKSKPGFLWSVAMLRRVKYKNNDIYCFLVKEFERNSTVVKMPTAEGVLNKDKKSNYWFLLANNRVYKLLPLILQIQSLFWIAVLTFFLCALSFISILFYIKRWRKIQAKTERERREVSHAHELDVIKTEFLTSISYELRSHILQIIGPIELMMKEPDNSNNQSKLQIVHQSSMRLLSMIDKPTDFSKMAAQKLQLDLKEGDVIKYINEYCNLFVSAAEKKLIKFIVSSNFDTCFALFDHDKIGKILFSLVSNALKLTPGNGQVNIGVNLLETSHSGMALLEIKIADSGIGISAEKQAKIFEKPLINETPTYISRTSNDISLSVIKEFVILMGGVISVESEEASGSSFIVRLPLKMAKEQHIKLNDEQKPLVTVKSEFASSEKKDRTITILVVEDNYDFRTCLKEDLIRSYNIVEASNGRDGWQKALSMHPNLILSDINMPEIDGIDFCKKIRNDKRTEHIPFILITGLTAEKQELVGLEIGANDYITKPFNFEVLHFKIRNLLKHQRSAKETYQKQIEVKPSELEIEGPDEKFMKKVTAVIESNISNTGFSVEMLSGKVNMSRVALYKKIFQLSGKRPIEFIKTLRMKRALKLLEMNQFTIAEIAYQVGYNDPKYFSRAFKSEFSVLPSHYQSTVGKVS